MKKTDIYHGGSSLSLFRCDDGVSLSLSVTWWHAIFFFFLIAVVLCVFLFWSAAAAVAETMGARERELCSALNSTRRFVAKYLYSDFSPSIPDCVFARIYVFFINDEVRVRGDAMGELIVRDSRDVFLVFVMWNYIRLLIVY